MKITLTQMLSRIGIFFLIAALCSTCQTSRKEHGESPSEAGAAFLAWSAPRMFPDGILHTEAYCESFSAMQLSSQWRGDRSPTWEAIGPKNIGGRTLCLAENPLDTNILWLGSASGGIWKTTSGGRGATAWQRVETGFPILGVSALALEPGNPNVIYAGTGEVYNVENSQPNVAIRTTRGTYGIGILKSSNGGVTWQKSLNWDYGQVRGVQDIKINPKRPATVFAATSEGLFRSWNAGATWQNIFPQKMAVDIEIDPVDTNRIYCTFGSHQDDATSGIYRSVNGGASFSKLSNGLPGSYSGKALLALSPSQPNLLYVSIGNETAQEGLYKTTDGGDNWQLMNNEDVSKYQGWYAHDVAINPADPNDIVWVGIDSWKSYDGGETVQMMTYWYFWNFGYVAAGDSEGPPNYVHADIHRAYYSEQIPNKVFLVTDGGLFVSYDGGISYEGRNGGYQTQQFYANLGNSSTNSNIAIGGMQDNATAVYSGDPSWSRVIGGDGVCAAVYPGNNQIMFGGSQYLNMAKSTNGGLNWYGIGGEINEDAAFNGPFELSPSNPNIMYAGAQSIWRSDDAGESWHNASNGPVADGDVVLTIAINPTNPDELIFSTAPTTTSTARIYRLNVATGILKELHNFPNRYCMDICYDPTNTSTVYAVFGGFYSFHVYKSVNNGDTWTYLDAGIDNYMLPNVPFNSIIVDPLHPSNIYVGCDLGVWLSTNGGSTWSRYSTNAPNAMLAMHLSITADRKLRVATHGLGVWQTDLQEASSAKEPELNLSIQSIQPNPATESAVVHFNLTQGQTTSLLLLDISGKQLWTSGAIWLPAGDYTRPLPISDLPAGTYGVVLQTTQGKTGKLLVKR